MNKLPLTILLSFSLSLWADSLLAQDPIELPITVAAAAAAGDASPLRRYVPEECCRALTSLVGDNNERVLQVAEVEGYTYVLSQATIRNADEWPHGIFSKLDRSGNVVWRRRSPAGQYFTSFTVAKGGKFIVTGKGTSTMYHYENEPNFDSSFLLGINNKGETTFAREYSSLKVKGFEAFAGRHPGNLSEPYYFVGQSSNGNSDIEPTIYRTDATGTIAAQRAILVPNLNGSSNGDQDVNDVWQTDEGDLIMAANYPEVKRAEVIKYSVASRAAEGVDLGTGAVVTNVIQTSDEHIVAVGYKDGADIGTFDLAIWLFDKELAPLAQWRVPNAGLTNISSVAVPRYDKDNNNTFQIYIAGRTEAGPAVASMFIILRGEWELLTGSLRLISTVSGETVPASVSIAPGSNGNALAVAIGSRQSTNATSLLTTGRLSLRFDHDCFVARTFGGRPEVISRPTSVNKNTSSTYLPTPQSFSLSATGATSRRDCPPDVVDGCKEPYPIPTTGHFTIPRPANCTATEIYVGITDALDRPLRLSDREDHRRRFGTNEAITLDLTGETPGMYSVKLFGANGSLLHVAVVQVT